MHLPVQQFAFSRSSSKFLTMSDNRLEEGIIATGAKLVVLDPVQAYLGAAVDMHRANEVRLIMSRISTLAERYGCAFVLVGHMNKVGRTQSELPGTWIHRL